MSLFTVITLWLAKSFQFSGRASRSEYWKRFGMSLLVSIAFQLATLIPILLSSTQSVGPALIAIEDTAVMGLIIAASITLISFLMLSTTARRFQDHGWSGRWFKWMFFLLAPALLFMGVSILGMALGNNAITMIGMGGSFLTLFPTYTSIIYTFWIGFVKPDPMTNPYGPNPSEASQ